MNKIATRLSEISTRGGLRRLADVVAVDREARTVQISFSSEAAEVERWFGIETLSHAPGACNLSRLNNRAALLWMHKETDQRGVVEPGSAVIDGDRVGRCVIRLSKSAAGEQMLQDIDDHIITKVSVGYTVEGMRLVETRAEMDVYSITQWTPYEVSMVSIPADDTVGVGRSAEMPIEAEPAAAAHTLPTIETSQPAEAKRNMTEEEKAARAAAQQATEAAARQAGGDAERSRTRSIIDMGRQYANVDLAAQFVADGKSPEEFQRALLDKMNTHINKPLEEQVRSAEIGLTSKEAGSFSFMRAIRAQMPNCSPADRKAAAFELDCSAAAEKHYGKQARGILIPADVLNQRTFATNAGASGGSTSGGTGGNLIATELLSGSFTYGV